MRPPRRRLPYGCSWRPCSRSARTPALVPRRALGGAAPNGYLSIGGKQDDAGRQVLVKPGDRIVNHIPGGGGYGKPQERDHAAIAMDLKNGLISPEHAKQYYGYAAA